MHGARPGGALRILESGKVRQEFIILSDHSHRCWYLHISSRGTQLGFVLSLGTWSHLSVSGTLCKVHAIASTLSSHRETEAAGMWTRGLSADQGHRGSRSAGISTPAAPRRNWTSFPMQRLTGNLLCTWIFTWEGEHPALQAGLSPTVWREATNHLQKTAETEPQP